MHPTFLPFARAFALLALAAALPGQLVRGGDLITTNYGSLNAVFRIDHTGAVSTVYSGPPLAGSAGVAVTAGGDIVVADFGSNSLVRIDGQTGVASTIASNLGGPLRVVEGFAGDFLVTAGAALLRVSQSGAVTTVASAPMNRPFGVGLDLDGNYLVADDLGRAIYRVSPAGTVTPIHVGLPLRLPQGIEVFPNGDYAVIDGITDSVFRIDRATGVVSTWVPNAVLGFNPEGIVPDWSGGYFVSHSAASGSGVVAIDALGSVTPVAFGSPFSNLEDIARVPTLAGPSAPTTGPGSVIPFAIDAPAEAGRYYSLFLSASVYPGWQLPNDPRTMPLNIDAFFAATIGRNSPPLLAGWSGGLDASGRAMATVDLQLLPPGALTGLTLYAQGLTLTPQSALGTAFQPLRFTFQ